MKFEDESQNLRVRLRVIQVVVFLLLAVLGGAIQRKQFAFRRRIARRNTGILRRR